MTKGRKSTFFLIPANVPCCKKWRQTSRKSCNERGQDVAHDYDGWLGMGGGVPERGEEREAVKTF